MRADGYGADIELTDTAVVFHCGKAAAKIQGTDRISVPYPDIASIEYRPATLLVNGQMKLVVTVADVSFGETLTAARTAVRQGDDATDVTSQRVRDWSERYRSYGSDPNNHVNPESLVVHWRHKDAAAFAAIRDAINARIPSESSRSTEARGLDQAPGLVVPRNRIADLSVLHKKAQQGLEKAIEPDEELLVVQPGESAALVATNRRVLICKWGITTGSMFSSQLTSWDLAHITGVELRSGMGTVAIVIQTAGAQLVTNFARFGKGPNSVWEAPNALFIFRDGQQTAATLRRMVAEHHNAISMRASAPVVEDGAAQIRRFAALRDDGLISDDEFQAKKRSILGM